MSSSLLEEPAVQAATGSTTSHAERLRTSMMAMRLSFTWFGTRKTLSADQKDQAAESFGAEGSFLSAGKQLIDVKHPAFKAVSSVKNKAVRYFRDVSLPYPEAGIRLIRPDRLDEVNAQMEAFRGDLGDAPRTLLEELAKIRSGDVVLPTCTKEGLDSGTVRLRCVVEPDEAQKVLLHRLGVTLPRRLRRIDQLKQMQGNTQHQNERKSFAAKNRALVTA